MDFTFGSTDQDRTVIGDRTYDQLTYDVVPDDLGCPDKLGVMRLGVSCLGSRPGRNIPSCAFLSFSKRPCPAAAFTAHQQCYALGNNSSILNAMLSTRRASGKLWPFMLYMGVQNSEQCCQHATACVCAVCALR